nr:probable malonyl-CoA-acyl carrier protein transacylase, mitochondrial [Onthophagus taurus]
MSLFVRVSNKVLKKRFCRDVHTSWLFFKDNKENNESPLKKMLDEAASFDDLKSEHQVWATLPYGETAKIRKQGEYFQKEKKDPRDSTIILFPGQATQYVGMGKNLLQFPLVRDLFELASYLLKYDLLKLCLEGPKEKLDETRYAQPAVFVSSLAALEKLKEERPDAIDNCVATAGFSLGEITSLVFAGAIGFEDAIRLIRIRGEAMQMAGEMQKGSMVRVLYGPDASVGFACLKAKEWAIEKGDEIPECRVSNYLYPHSKIIAGSISAIEFLEKNAKEFKLKKVSRLAVSGAFHSDLMAPALQPVRKILSKINIEDPVINVYSNVDGKRYRNADHIRKQLPKQIIKPVKWEQTMHVLYERDQGEYFPRTFECGPGSSLKTILKQVNAKAWDHCVSIEA